MNFTEQDKARFHAKYQKGPDCWEWCASRHPRGYGWIRCRTHTILAHRFAWWVATGDMPGRSQVIRHRCDNPPCVRPDHLEIGTQADNLRDMEARGRRKLRITPEQVRAIYADPRTQMTIAATYGISQAHVSDIKRGRVRKADIND